MTAEAQITRWTMGLGAVAALVGAATAPRVGLGLALGAGLSLLNYLWLKAGVTALTSGESGRAMTGGTLRYLLRFALLGLALCGIFIRHLAPFVWVLAGLFAAPAATLAVGVRQLASGTHSQR